MVDSIILKEGFDFLKEAREKINDGMEQLKYMEEALKDMNDGKPPPAQNANWKKFVADCQTYSSKIQSLQLWKTVSRGDVSPALQNDCAQYLAVLDRFQTWHDILQASQGDIGGLKGAATDLQSTSDKLAAGSKAADTLMTFYAKLSQSAVEDIRLWFTKATVDMISVTHALNGAASDAAAKAKKANALADQLPTLLDHATTDLSVYQQRVPAMREYCAKHQNVAELQLPGVTQVTALPDFA
jgi:hypothetical protein